MREKCCEENYREVAEEIEGILDSYHQAKVFNGSAAVLFKGQVLLDKGFGWADFPKQEPITGQTRFFIGSNSKQFTAALIFLLADKGILDINRPITDYLPYFRKDTGRKITIYHLLTHTSGIYNYTEHPDLHTKKSFCEEDIPEMIREISSLDLEFEPGTRFHYSNSNYFILGGIIEELLGQPFSKTLEEYITIPLGLTNTGYYKGDEDMSLFANIAELPLHRPGQFFSAGNIYSSSADMTKWIGLLTAGDVIPAKYREIAFRTNYNNYACGIASVEAALPEFGSLMKEQLDFISKSVWKGDKVYRFFLHRGVAGAFSSFWLAVPELSLIVVLLNSIGSSLDLDEAVYFVAKALFRQEIRGGNL